MNINVRRIIGVVLAVFVLAGVFCGAASAFTISSGPTVNPSGGLVPGDKVTATVEIKLLQGAADASSKISFDTDLVGDSWQVDIIKGDMIANTKHPSDPYCYITGFDLDFDVDIVLRVSVEGTVASTSAGKQISVMKITAAGMHDGGLSYYETPGQLVYDTSNLKGQLATLGSAIDDVNTRCAYYQTHESDVSKVQNYARQAKEKYDAAEKAGTADAVTAYTNLDEGNKLVKQAQTELALAALSMALTYTTAVDNDVVDLYSLGMNSDAKLIDTKNQGFKNTYNQLLAVYKGGSNPDPAELDALAVNTLALHDEAVAAINGLSSGSDPGSSSSSSSSSIDIMKYLPFILIGVGVVVVGLVIFLVIRRRKNTWDELG